MADQQVLAGRVTFALTAASAGVQALQQALKDAPDVIASPLVPDMTTGAWNYLPIILISMAASVWIWERFFRLGESITGTAPKAPTSDPASTAQREYIEEGVTYPDLLSRLKGKTDLQRETLAQPFLGKWLKIEGTLSNVSSALNGGVYATIDLLGDTWVLCTFDSKWRETISAVHVGDTVTIEGCIKSLTRGSGLDRCELIGVRPTPPKPPRRRRTAPKSAAKA